MALNKLKKWIGTQAMTAFFDQLNDNVDATNAAIDLVESHLADYANISSVSTTRNRMRVVEGSVLAQKIGKLVIITFKYNPSLNSVGFGRYDTSIITVNNFTPKYTVAGTAYPVSSVDVVRKVMPYIISSGHIGVVNDLNSNTDSGAWNCTLIYLTD